MPWWGTVGWILVAAVIGVTAMNAATGDDLDAVFMLIAGGAGFVLGVAGLIVKNLKN